MPCKRLFFPATLALLALGTPLFGMAQMQGMKMAPANHSESGASALDATMMDHQKEMQTLLANLQKSFQAVVDAKDANGYVHDKSILKAHEADITALRNAVRSHKLFLTAEEQKCGLNSKNRDAMTQHQQEMKGVLYDVVDTFSTYQSADDSSIESSEPVEDALNAHRKAIKELVAASAEHQQAMTQMPQSCS